jgi:hypothetical protein
MIRHSGTDDRYAQAFSSIQSILTSMLRCHTAIEEWIRSKRLTTKPVTLNLFEEEQLPPILKFLAKPHCNWQVLPLPFMFLQTLEASIYSICTTFYSNLDRLAFEEKYAEKLQKFVDFSI